MRGPSGRLINLAPVLAAMCSLGYCGHDVGDMVMLTAGCDFDEWLHVAAVGQ